MTAVLENGFASDAALETALEGIVALTLSTEITDEFLHRTGIGFAVNEIAFGNARLIGENVRRRAQHILQRWRIGMATQTMQVESSSAAAEILDEEQPDISQADTAGSVNTPPIRRRPSGRNLSLERSTEPDCNAPPMAPRKEL